MSIALQWLTVIAPLLVVVLTLLLKKKVEEVHDIVNHERDLMVAQLAAANAKIDRLISALPERRELPRVP